MIPPRAPHLSLFGRDALVASVCAALAHDPWITLKGPPGVGKSTLTRALRATVTDRPWRCVSALSASTRPSMLAAIACALEVELRFADDTAAFRAVAEALDATRAVLVIDDADYASVMVTDLVSDLTAVCERVTVIVCAWRASGVALERVIDVAPLSVPSAVALLRARIERRAHTAAVSDEDARAIVERASCLPLAIELAASRVAALGAEAVLRSSRETTAFATLDQSIEAALSSLDRADARAALSALAVFEEDFDAHAAVAVIGADSLAPLERLVEASLVEAAHDAETTRFRVLSVVRDFVARTAADPAARDRYVAYWASLPRANTDDQSRWTRVAAARTDLLSAWKIAASQPFVTARGPGAAVALALLLEPLLLTRGPAELHRAVLSTTIELAVSSAEHASALVELELCVGKIDVIRGHFRRAIVAIRAALARAERAELPLLAGWCSVVLSFSLRPLEALDESESFARRALAIAQSQQDHRLAAQAEQGVATVALSRGDHSTALEGYRRAFACARLSGSPRVEGVILANLSYASLRAGRYDDALQFCRQSRALFERRSDRVHLARVAVLEEMILVAAGRASSDRGLLAALDAVVAQGDLQGELDARESLALFAHARGDMALFRQRVDELGACAKFTDDFEWPARVEALQQLARAQRPSRTTATLSLSRRGDRVVVNENHLDFSRRGPLKRVLLALVEAHARGVVMSPAEVQCAGWPGERMRAESAAARVYMAIRRLRAMGLGALIRTSDEGYSLDPETRVRWLDEAMLADVRRRTA